MPTLDDVVRRYTDLSAQDREWLHRLVADWHMLADLSFADLVLWVAVRDGAGYRVAAQMRPTTGPTAHVSDLIGTFGSADDKPLLDLAYRSGEVHHEGDPELRAVVPSRASAIPVRHADRVIAVILRNTNVISPRTPSPLERTYVRTAGALAQMISEGRFPRTGQQIDLDASPRVGDGLIRLDGGGVVSYASPNAQSAFSRLGLATDLKGRNLGVTTAELIGRPKQPVDEGTMTVLSGRAAREAEIENSTATVLMRVIPLVPRGVPDGALVLLRDVTDLRRRERELITKDATIREIHHRVKNNLQTVAALLRLQARRVDHPDAKAVLADSERRVGTIAIVHETLAHGADENVDFDEVTDRMRQMVLEMENEETRRRLKISRSGRFGMIKAETATPLAMILNEVLANAVEHGVRTRGSGVWVTVDRKSERTRIIVEDDGVGLPEGFDPRNSTRLGLQIVRTLAENELGGEFAMGPRPGASGTRVVLDLPGGPG